MRVILFRGKAFSGNEWEYGVPVFCGLNNELAFMKQMHSYDHQVIPETVGQFTGLTDKNGKKIFEGDILRITERGKTADGGIVVFENGYPGGWLITDKTYSSKCSLAMRNDVEVIGNIHDNPELLGGEEDGNTV